MVSKSEMVMRARRTGSADHAATRREFVLDEPARAHLSTWEGMYDIREFSDSVWGRLHIRRE